MRLAELAKNKFVVTCEISSPKGTNLDDFLNRVDAVKACVDAVSIGDNQRAVMRAGALAVCHLLKKRNIEPVMELACRDRNRLALQSEMLGAAIMGIENVVLVCGHDPAQGDHAQAKMVNDLDCVALVETAVCLMRGNDIAGHPIDGTPDFCLGVVANPGLINDKAEMAELKAKLERGACFIQTQPVYDTEVMEQFLKATKDFQVPVFAGLMPLKSASMASFINSNFPGIKVPDKTLRALEGLPREKVIETSLDLSAELVKKLKGMCQGVNFMPEGWERHVAGIIERAGI